MVWILKEKLKKDIKTLNNLIVSYAPEKTKEQFIIRNQIGLSSLNAMEDSDEYIEALNEYISENLIELNNIAEFLSEKKKISLDNAVRRVGYELSKDRTLISEDSEEHDIKNRNMTDKEYWKLARALADEFYSNGSMLTPISQELKMDILDKIYYSFSKRAYYLSKVIVYGELSEENILNFVFYNVIYRKKFFELSIQNPDTYGTTFMFHMRPEELPPIKDILTQTEYVKLCETVQLARVYKELRIMTVEDLNKILPKSMKYFGKRNPFIINS